MDCAAVLEVLRAATAAEMVLYWPLLALAFTTRAPLGGEVRLVADANEAARKIPRKEVMNFIMENLFLKGMYRNEWKEMCVQQRKSQYVMRRKWYNTGNSSNRHILYNFLITDADLMSNGVMQKVLASIRRQTGRTLHHES